MMFCYMTTAVLSKISYVKLTMIYSTKVSNRNEAL